MNHSVQRAYERLNAAYAVGMANARLRRGSSRWRPELFQNGEIGKEFARAYEVWMEARAAMGDVFALSLGYGSP